MIFHSLCPLLLLQLGSLLSEHLRGVIGCLKLEPTVLQRPVRLVFHYSLMSNKSDPGSLI
jgi:hypothetical protein